MRVAVVVAMRGPSMSPRVENCASFPISQIRSRTRRRGVPDHDIIVGRPSRQPRTDCHSKGYHHASNEIGRTGSAFCGTNWTWCSWADALPMLHDRLPIATEEMLAQLRGEPEGCLRELQVASMLLDREGFVSKPSWELSRGKTTSL